MIQQMSGGGWKVFNSDGNFTGAFHDKELAEKVDKLERLLINEEIDEFGEGKIMAAPNSVSVCDDQAEGAEHEHMEVHTREVPVVEKVIKKKRSVKKK